MINDKYKNLNNYTHKIILHDYLIIYYLVDIY